MVSRPALILAFALAFTFFIVAPPFLGSPFGPYPSMDWADVLDLFTPLFGLAASSFVIGTYDFIRVSIERQRYHNMSIVDGLTGLYHINYFRMNVDTEVMLAKADKNKKFP